MTVIVKGSKIFRVKFTPATTQMSEELGYDICGKELVNATFGGGIVRGYVVVELVGVGTINRGPVILDENDVEEVEYQ